MATKSKKHVQAGDGEDDDERVFQFSIRLSRSFLERLDGHVARLVAGAPGLTLSRTQAIKALVKDGLDRAEAEEARKKAAQPPQ